MIDRLREYAAVGVPFFLRVVLRNRVPTMALFELSDGEYRPLAAAAAGSTFAMREPFEFSIDPADLLDERSRARRAESPLDRHEVGEVGVSGSGVTARSAMWC
ncbi:hypothetical protein AB0K35_31580 [Micromonospora sp. NPDC053740]|uniref:hypothetical protein n=1 Tax=Micromonospora sp. NPDC053740 TaxID=3155173 RepID=UPI00341DFD51